MTSPVDNGESLRRTYPLKARIVQANGFHAPESRCCGQGMGIIAQALCSVISAILYLVANAMKERFYDPIVELDRRSSRAAQESLDRRVVGQPDRPRPGRSHTQRRHRKGASSGPGRTRQSVAQRTAAFADGAEGFHARACAARAD